MYEQRRHVRIAYSASLLAVAGWGCLLYFGVTRGLKFLDNTNWSLTAPVGSPAYVANMVADEFLRQKSTKYELSQAAVVVARQPQQHPVTHPAIRNLTQRMLDITLAECPVVSGISRDYHGLAVCWWRNLHGIFAPDGNALAPHWSVGPDRLFEDTDLDVWQELMSPDNCTGGSPHIHHL